VVSFSDVLSTLLRVCESRPDFAGVTKAVAVRDLRGRMHLALQVGSNGPSLDDSELERDLVAQLGNWFVPPLLGSTASQETARLRQTILGWSAPWPNASWTDSTGVHQPVRPGRWHIIERRLSKLSWVEHEKSTPPWPLLASKPAIVTFYSFKGGVGRTTLLASTAWQLAKASKRVVVVDLDVEAPGVGTLLGAESDRGVVDFLVDHAATGSSALEGIIAPAQELGPEAALVDVIPAGRLDHDYFEKLARLDFVGSGLLEPGGIRPVREALLALMRAVAARSPSPDYILLDSRAGLHDLAGLSLHDLAHVDVIVGRDSDQGYQGLELTVAALGQRRSFQDLRSVVVQTMAPDDPASESYRELVQAYRQRSYDAFAEHVYRHIEEEDDLPKLDDEEVSHYPHVVRFEARLVNFTSLAVRSAEILGDDFRRVADRIIALCVPEVVS
jgi:MinD-like ATPase involved in chromosome partitioning or flagellar assembly